LHDLWDEYEPLKKTNLTPPVIDNSFTRYLHQSILTGLPKKLKRGFRKDGMPLRGEMIFQIRKRQYLSIFNKPEEEKTPRDTYFMNYLKAR